jgi:hypothetical protein
LTRGTEQLNAIAVFQIRLGFVHMADWDEERAVLDAERTQLIAPGCYEVRTISTSRSDSDPLRFVQHFLTDAVDLCHNESPR